MSTHHPDILSQLINRGQIAQITHEDSLKQQLMNTKSSCYLGIDPTAKSLHVGHMVSLNVAKQLQQAGHQIIIVIGSATALIGDPSGKSTTRAMLTQPDLTQNVASITKQLKQFIDFSDPSSARLVFNADWLGDLNYLDLLTKVGRHFSVNRMLAAECYKNRLEDHLSFLEFNYMLLQSYDFYHLHKKYGVNIQLGGNDQWSHMLAGIDLIRKMTTHQAYAITTPLLVNSKGEKMGKTTQGALWLDPNLCRVLDFFQYWRNINDEDLLSCFQLLTTVPQEDLENLNTVLSAKQINTFKIQLAREITTLVHGDDESQKASLAAQQLYAPSSSSSTSSLAELVSPALLPSSHFRGQSKLSIQEVLMAYDVVSSKKEARRLIDQGGLKINGMPCSDPFLIIHSHSLMNEGLLVQKGKKATFLLKLQ